jgi:hypothetical protein
MVIFGFILFFDVGRIPNRVWIKTHGQQKVLHETLDNSILLEVYPTGYLHTLVGMAMW